MPRLGAESALDAALRLLAVRPRSEAELRHRLERRGVAHTVIEATLVSLRALGLADDLAFARFWREQRAAFRPSGRRRLTAELRSKGVAPEIIAEALQEQDDGGAIESIARQRAVSLGDADGATFRRRLQAFLLRRGYDASLVRETVKGLERERSR